jgi:hypothetical protein
METNRDREKEEGRGKKEEGKKFIRVYSIPIPLIPNP